MKKVFKVLVVYESGGNVFVEADNETEARERALKAIDGGAGSIIPDFSCESGHKVSDVIEVSREELDRDERHNLSENEESINEHDE